MNLRALFEEYAQTLDDKDACEINTTYRVWFELLSSNFLSWLEKREADPRADCRTAFADGKKIQVRLQYCGQWSEWVPARDPAWSPNAEYRIDPGQ